MTKQQINMLVTGLLLLVAGIVIYLVINPVSTYAQDVFYNNTTYPQQTVNKYLFGKVTTTLPDGTKITWNGTAWTQA